MKFCRIKAGAISFSILTSFLFSGAAIQTAFGEDTSTDATETTWGIISTNDGFDKTLTIYKDADNVGVDDYGDAINYTTEIQCTKKKLTFMVYSAPIGMYPTTTYSSIDGYALTKIDSGKIMKYPYVALKDDSGIFFTSPKTVTTAVLKGKRSFSFKIQSSIQAASVANFTIGDLSSYAIKFKSLGCPLK
jgi:hypothetical protein